MARSRTHELAADAGTYRRTPSVADGAEGDTPKSKLHAGWSGKKGKSCRSSGAWAPARPWAARPDGPVGAGCASAARRQPADQRDRSRAVGDQSAGDHQEPVERRAPTTRFWCVRPEAPRYNTRFAAPVPTPARTLSPCERHRRSRHRRVASNHPRPRFRVAVHPAHRAPAARAVGLLRDPAVQHAARRRSRAEQPVGIILSGGPESVYEAGAPHCDRARASSSACRCSASATACS